MLFEWLEPDYYRRQRWIRRTVRVLCWALALAGVLYVALTFWPGSRSVYQNGPLSPGHAFIRDDCSRCHTKPFATAEHFRPGPVGDSSVPDENCTQCHDGPIHHKQQTYTPRCGSCHREHRGQTLLARVADSHCTACHAHLQQHALGPTQFKDVYSFTGDHPPFNLQQVEPPRLHFSHQAHLEPGRVLGPGRKAEVLTCASCHKPDPERRYMLPVRYQAQCARCHPLTVQLVGAWKDDKTRAAAESFRKHPAPHRPPAEVRAALQDRLEQFVWDHPKVIEAAGLGAPPRPIPGSRPRRARLTGDAADWVASQLEQAERGLFDGAGGCRHCHVPKQPIGARACCLPEYLPAKPLDLWLPHSRFSHKSHGLLQCTACHPAATAKGLAADMLLPTLNDCRRCHNPEIGVRSDCGTCHRYHDRSKEGEVKGSPSIDDALCPSPARRP
jgi:hypothetical protein